MRHSLIRRTIGSCLFIFYCYALGSMYSESVITADKVNPYSAIGFAALVVSIAAFPSLLKGEENSLVTFITILISPAITSVLPFVLTGRFAFEYAYIILLFGTFAFGFWIVFKPQKLYSAIQAFTRRTFGFCAVVMYFVMSITLHTEYFLLDGKFNEFAVLGFLFVIFSLVLFILMLEGRRYFHTLFTLSVALHVLPFTALAIVHNHFPHSYLIITGDYLLFAIILWITFKPQKHQTPKSTIPQ